MLNWPLERELVSFVPMISTIRSQMFGIQFEFHKYPNFEELHTDLLAG